VGAYLDLYGGYFFGKTNNGHIPYFVSASRSGEATVNLAYIEVKYSAERVRARFAPGFGTYMNANYAAEPNTLQHIVEGSAGVLLSKKKGIWLDAGVFGSPYTNESCISKDHLVYSRSFAPEYVPYYLAGAKLSVPLSPKLTLYAYLLNGWQQIQDQNKGKALGTQLEWKPNAHHTFNFNTFIGDERSEAAPQNRMRYFADAYWLYAKGKWSATACTYIGVQERLNAQGEKEQHVWWQANVMGKYQLRDKYSLSGRIEYFNDPNSVQITPITSSAGFSAYSGSLCFNAQIAPTALFRLEARQFMSPKHVFVSEAGKNQQGAAWLLGSIAVWLP
jgi:hypothetical protein